MRCERCWAEFDRRADLIQHLTKPCPRTHSDECRMRLLAKIGVFPFAYTFSYEHKDPDGREIQYEDEEEIVSERARVKLNNLQLRWHLMALMNTDQFMGWPTETVEIVVEDVMGRDDPTFYLGSDLAKGCERRPRLEGKKSNAKS